MRKQHIFSFLLIVAATLSSAAIQEQQHFYDVDKEIKVEGTILEIIMEPRYKNSSPFLIVILKEKNSEQKYRIELSPIWFFDYDLHQGENLRVTGSLYTAGENDLNIIAKEVRFRGEILALRDKHGFPNWRGGKMRQKGRKKGPGF